MTFDDLEDEISDAISDSIDMGWTSRDGAKAVVRFLNERAPGAADLSKIGERIADEVEKVAAGRQSNCEQAARDIAAMLPHHAGETAWLIEQDAAAGWPVWFTAKGPEWRFSRDANEALRFSRKEDAETFIRWIGSSPSLENPRATEHRWLPA